MNKPAVRYEATVLVAAINEWLQPGPSRVIRAAPEVHTPVRSGTVTAPVRGIGAVGRCHPFGQRPQRLQTGQHLRAIV